jgi:hypothetical protein
MVNGFHFCVFRQFDGGVTISVSRFNGRSVRLDLIILVNFDFGVVISPESRSQSQMTLDVKYNELFERVWVKVEDELELYNDCGMFPAVRVRAVLWKCIAEILAKTASKTERESLTKISEMAESLIEIRELNGEKMILKEPQ